MMPPVEPLTDREPEAADERDDLDECFLKRLRKPRFFLGGDDVCNPGDVGERGRRFEEALERNDAVGETGREFGQTVGEGAVMAVEGSPVEDGVRTSAGEGGLFADERGRR